MDVCSAPTEAERRPFPSYGRSGCSCRPASAAIAFRIADTTFTTVLSSQPASHTNVRISLFVRSTPPRIFQIDGDKDEDGNLIPETIYIHFKHPAINDRLAKFAKTKKWQENLLASKDAFPSEEAFQQEVAQMNETCEQIKQHLVDTNIVVKKGISGIAVKVYPEK